MRGFFRGLGIALLWIFGILFTAWAFWLAEAEWPKWVVGWGAVMYGIHLWQDEQRAAKEREERRYEELSRRIHYLENQISRLR